MHISVIRDTTSYTRDLKMEVLNHLEYVDQVKDPHRADMISNNYLVKLKQ